MAYKITFKYTPVAAPIINPVAPICRVMQPANAAADMPAFQGTYYDTNVDGWGEGTALAAYMQQLTAHPGLVAAIKQAIKNGECVIEDATSKDALYMNEVAPALESQGITILVEKAEAAE